MRLYFLLFIIQASRSLQYVSHVFQFSSISYTSGLYHIHSPSYFIEANGFAMPGFCIQEVQKPKILGDYITADFTYKTYFNQGIGRVFSERLNTSRVLLSDDKGNPILYGTLCLENVRGKVLLRANSDMMRPPTVWEEMMKCRVTRSDVERAIARGYTNFKSDMNLKLYLNMVLIKNK